ncbi:fungal-specific transcription factor domain-containing protein [Cyathus striatus]|nr:fungal-specific transcription factor domain-containing protein [Cyathus striatus]
MPAITTKNASPSPAKKPGPSKSKGAVRAKSGCYTCRIRRKKCDEQQNEHGQCQTCIRLRLQCLGFGAKRPEWLRENRNVVELREKIKNFLASQGMIKGHSGTGPRSSEQEPNFLRLSDDPTYEHSSSSESPPTHPAALYPDDLQRRSTMSDVRTQPHPHSAPWHPGLEPPYNTAPYGLFSHWESPDSYSLSSRLSPGILPPHDRRSHSPGGSQGSVHEYHHFSNSLVQTNNRARSPRPALRSQLAPSYNIYLSEDILNADEDMVPEVFEPTATPGAIFPHTMHDRMMHTFNYKPHLLEHYFNRVMNVQFLLGDKNLLLPMMLNLVHSSDAPREAARALANVHWIRHQSQAPYAIDSDEDSGVLGLEQLFSKLHGAEATTETAIAALHAVSVYLFDGGDGAWDRFLHIAVTYVTNMLFGPQFDGPRDALLRCDPQDAFVIKTALWFDVLASVSLQKQPNFYQAIKEMFQPDASGIYDSAMLDTNSQYSMLNPMGCENHVVWALAEASYLSDWKEHQVNRGSLSILELVRKAENILQHMIAPPSQNEEYLYGLDETTRSRLRASELFHWATRLYLQTIVSGDYPHVPEIRVSVRDTFECIKRIVHDQAVSAAVIRSTVFGLFICGCFCESQSEQEFILRALLNSSQDGNSSATVGNCHTIAGVLKSIWTTQLRRTRQEPINWRAKLATSKGRILLV